jgi:hypothetical protein
VSEFPTSPYKGLSAFDDSDVDALLFFGREREREIIVANLIASRFTVLYGPSGVGKSSLLRAAVARTLRELPEQPLVVVFSRWGGDPARGLVDAVGGDSVPLIDALTQAQSERDVYVILDQAEEYFLYHADDAGPASFADALRRPDRRTLREHAPARSARPGRGRSGDRATRRALLGDHG